MGNSLCTGAFVPVLWRFPGHFLVYVGVCPGFVALSGTFSFCGEVCPGISAIFGTFLHAEGIFSWFGGRNKDVLLHLKISSRFCGTFRDIFFLRQGLSRNFSDFRDISPCRKIYSLFHTQNKDVLLPHNKTFSPQNCYQTNKYLIP